MEACRYCYDGVCHNGLCPVSGEDCPVTEIAGLCRYEDRREE